MSFERMEPQAPLYALGILAVVLAVVILVALALFAGCGCVAVHHNVTVHVEVVGSSVEVLP